jgi:hypothetical protein
MLGIGGIGLDTFLKIHKADLLSANFGINPSKKGEPGLAASQQLQRTLSALIGMN